MTFAKLLVYTFQNETEKRIIRFKLDKGTYKV
uniref:Uncharacterized protein n=1 Tax=Arundo donax TaxID=35708 RepID=A0A0A8XWB9_ARUDO